MCRCSAVCRRARRAGSRRTRPRRDPERPVVVALEADRRGGLEVEAGAAAERAAEVAGPDLDVVGEGQQPLVQGPEHLGGPFARLDREVGQGDVADEQRVAAEHRPGGAVAAGVAEQEGGVLGPVAGGVDRLDRHLAEVEDPAVGERLVRVLGGGQLVDVDGGAGRPRQAAVAGDVVGVVVGLEDVLDPHPVQPRQPPVGVDVPLRVDHRRVARVAVGDEVGRAAEVLVDDLTEKHPVVPPLRRLARKRHGAGLFALLFELVHPFFEFLVSASRLFWPAPRVETLFLSSSLSCF